LGISYVFLFFLALDVICSTFDAEFVCIIAVGDASVVHLARPGGGGTVAICVVWVTWCGDKASTISIVFEDTSRAATAIFVAAAGFG
jgi:hypothetical protein